MTGELRPRNEALRARAFAQRRDRAHATFKRAKAIARTASMHGTDARASVRSVHAAPRALLASLPLQILLYFGAYYDAFYVLVTIGIFIYKGETPSASGARARVRARATTPS